MALEKLKIYRENPDWEGGDLSTRFIEEDAFEVMFNPNTYTVTKAVSWSKSQDSRADAPTVAFAGGGAQELSFELLFDATEGKDADVRDHCHRVVTLANIMRNKAKPRPPICRLQWGDFPILECLLTSVTQKFTLFSREGAPLRATLNVTFTEFLSRETNLRIIDPEQSTRTVRQGETFASIASKLGIKDWRLLALKNPHAYRKGNPRDLIAGAVLTVPSEA